MTKTFNQFLVSKGHDLEQIQATILNLKCTNVQIQIEFLKKLKHIRRKLEIQTAEIQTAISNLNCTNTKEN